MRFVTKAGRLYVHLFDAPASTEIVIEGSDLPAVSHAIHLSTGNRIAVTRDEAGLRLSLPAPLPTAPAHAFAF